MPVFANDEYFGKYASSRVYNRSLSSRHCGLCWSWSCARIMFMRTTKMVLLWASVYLQLRIPRTHDLSQLSHGKPVTSAVSAWHTFFAHPLGTSSWQVSVLCIGHFAVTAQASVHLIFVVRALFHFPLFKIYRSVLYPLPFFGRQ